MERAPSSKKSCLVTRNDAFFVKSFVILISIIATVSSSSVSVPSDPGGSSLAALHSPFCAHNSTHRTSSTPMHSIFRTSNTLAVLKINEICREVFGEMEKILKGVPTIKQEYKKNRRKSIERAGAAENK